jgi:cell division protein FtsB
MQLAQRVSFKLYEWRTKIATAGVALFALYVAFHVVFGANGMRVYERKKSDHQRLQQEVQQMQSENEQLQKSIQNLKTDPKTIEKEAREQLKYARPGEVVYVLPAMPAPKSDPSPDATAENKPTK